MSVSIATNSLFSVAPVAAPHIFGRQFRIAEPSDDNVKCTPKVKDTEYVECPKVTEPFQRCATGGLPIEEMDEDDGYADKESCVDKCNMIHSGDAVKWALECFKDQCTDASEHEERNKELMTEAFELLYVPICKRLGLEEVTTKESSAGLVKGWKGASVVAALVFGSVFSGLVF